MVFSQNQKVSEYVETCLWLHSQLHAAEDGLCTVVVRVCCGSGSGKAEGQTMRTCDRTTLHRFKLSSFMAEL